MFYSTPRESGESFDSTTPLLTYALEQSALMVHVAREASIAATTKVANVRAWIRKSFIVTYNGYCAGCDDGYSCVNDNNGYTTDCK